MKIGIFADAHGANIDISCKTRRPSLSLHKISEAMTAFADCDAVIALGDLVDDCGTREKNIEYLQNIAKVIKSFDIPFYCMLGNHDCLNFSKSEFYEISGFERIPFSAAFGETTLIFLDACFSSSGESYSPNGVDWTDSYVSAEQIKQLKYVLNECKTAYVFVHQCLDDGVEHRHIIKNAAEIRKIIFESQKVKAVYQGHYHSGRESIIDKIPYHTVPAMVEGETNSFEIIEI